MPKPVFDLKEITSILGKVDYGTGYVGHIATIVSYARPVPIKYYAINLHLFEECKDKKIRKSGEQWTVRFQQADEYEVSMTASGITVVSNFGKDIKSGFSQTRRIQDNGENYLMRPITTEIDILPGQTLRRENREIDMYSSEEEGDAISVVSNNALWSKTLEETAMNHKKLSEQLFESELEKYGPRLEGVIPVPIELLISDKIPKPNKK